MSSGLFSKMFGGLFKGKPPEQDQKDESEPEFEHSDSGYLDRTTEDSDCFTFRINGLGMLSVPRAIIIHADKTALTVSEPIKTSRKPEKRIAMLNKMLDEDTWRASAKRYDMRKISTASFRMAQRPFKWTSGSEIAHVIVMDYGRRPIDMNYAHASSTLFTNWKEEGAILVLERLRDAVAHVQGTPSAKSADAEELAPQPPSNTKDTPDTPRDNDPF